MAERSDRRYEGEEEKVVREVGEKVEGEEKDEDFEEDELMMDLLLPLPLLRNARAPGNRGKRGVTGGM